MTVNTIPKGLCKGGMKVDGKIVNIAKAIKTKTIERRRDFHRYAEAAWTEFRTAAIVADTLEQLGYCVLTGDEVIEAEAMMGVPSLEELEHHMKRALAQNGKLSWIEKMKGGKTGVVGVIRFAKPGPVVALRLIWMRMIYWKLKTINIVLIVKNLHQSIKVLCMPVGMMVTRQLVWRLRKSLVC